MAKRRNAPKKAAATSPASRAEAAKRRAADRQLDILHRQVREILAAARERAWQAVNTVMVEAYWEVGRVIVEDEQTGKQRASYGKRVLEGLAERLQAEFGKGFDQSNLRNMRAFFITYPIRDAQRRELSWLTASDENPPIGIVLCTDKSEAVVRYALPEGNTQIFASRYKLHLPTEEELATELQREARPD